MRMVSNLVASAWMAYAAVAADAPQAKLSETTQDHGTVFIGAKINGKFFVENTGTVPFSIVDAKTSCHCTTAVPSKDPIPPGGRGEVSYEVTSSGVGKSAKNIRIVTDPPMTEQLIFTSSVTFAPYIEAAAEDLAVDVSQGDLLDIRVPLHIANGVEGVKVLGAKTRSRDVDLSIEGPKDGADNVLVVKSTKPLPAGRRPVLAELEFEKDGKSIQNLTVTVNVIPAIQITPAPISVIFEPDKDEATISITLKSSKGQPFAIKSITPKVCAIRDVALPQAPAAEHTVPVTFVRTNERYAMRGFLTFEFDGDFGKQTIFTIYQRDLGAASANAGQQILAP